jgi:endonuclease/exonuclease/phosphatase family metal-dependent hydrolase
MHHKNDFTIMSLNVWYGELLGDLLAYITSKKDSVSAFCFQETDHATLQALDKLLGGEFARHHMHKNAASEAEQFYVATYIRHGIPVISMTNLLEDIPKAGAGLACELQLSSGKTLRLVNVHGQPRPGHKLDTPERIAQSQSLLRSAAHDDTPTVFVGDFNLLPEAHSVQLFSAAGYRNLIDDYSIATTRNELAWQRYPDNKQLHVDYAFTRLNNLFNYDFSVDDVPVSDHLPLILTLRHAPPLHHVRVLE